MDEKVSLKISLNLVKTMKMMIISSYLWWNAIIYIISLGDIIWQLSLLSPYIQTGSEDQPGQKCRMTAVGGNYYKHVSLPCLVWHHKVIELIELFVWVAFYHGWSVSSGHLTDIDIL